MRILYVGMKYEYGQPELGYSFEHHNFYESLLQMGHHILYFDYATLLREHGREWMNRRLAETARAEGADLMFTVLFEDEIDPKVVRDITDTTDTVTLNWFCDDHWRFESFSRHWAPCFNWVVTTAQSAVPRYSAAGFQNVIKSQWACNHFLYRKMDLPLEYDVTFVGQPHGDRRQVIQALLDSGIKVRVWGRGWPSGRLPQEEMIRVFNQSRINLNLSNALGARRRHRLMLWKNRGLPQQQIKGRNFEVPGCGGFLLTGRAENLDDYYRNKLEIVTFKNVPDLIRQIRHYLKNEDERTAIAGAGYERTVREHTYQVRFREIFAQIGLQT